MNELVAIGAVGLLLGAVNGAIFAMGYVFGMREHMHMMSKGIGQAAPPSVPLRTTVTDWAQPQVPRR